MQVRNDSASIQVARVLVGLGDEFESANAAVMYHARSVVSASAAATGEQQKEPEVLKEADESTNMLQENWYDGLTYCEYQKTLSCPPKLSGVDINRHLECSWATTH